MSVPIPSVVLNLTEVCATWNILYGVHPHSHTRIIHTAGGVEGKRDTESRASYTGVHVNVCSALSTLSHSMCMCCVHITVPVNSASTSKCNTEEQTSILHWNQHILMTRLSVRSPSATLTSLSDADLHWSAKSLLLALVLRLLKYITDNVTQAHNAEAQKRRHRAPLPLREKCWIRWFGPLLNGQCYVCGKDIRILQFHCGHIVAHADYGLTEESNLVPMCGSCNCSIGSADVYEFMSTHRLSATLTPWPMCRIPCCTHQAERRHKHVCHRHRYYGLVLNIASWPISLFRLFLYIPAFFSLLSAGIVWLEDRCHRSASGHTSCSTEYQKDSEDNRHSNSTHKTL